MPLLSLIGAGTFAALSIRYHVGRDIPHSRADSCADSMAGSGRSRVFLVRVLVVVIVAASSVVGR